MSSNVGRVRDTVETIELNGQLDIVSYLNVWSNGKVVRRYTGQGESSKWRNPSDGYRKIVAILVEVEEE